jgi:DNA topoisomerase-3
MKDYSKSIVSDIKNSSETFKHDNMTRIKCPQCGKFMLEVKGKKGRMLICQDRDCGYRKNVSRITNARCPNCHKKMELQGEGDNQIFVCGCGYREKLSAFDNRRKNEKNTVSKKEVANYLREQKNSKKEPINTELADALKGLKLK